MFVAFLRRVGSLLLSFVPSVESGKVGRHSFKEGELWYTAVKILRVLLCRVFLNIVCFVKQFCIGLYRTVEMKNN